MCCVCLPRTLSKFALRPGEVCVCVVCMVCCLILGLRGRCLGRFFEDLGENGQEERLLN